MTTAMNYFYRNRGCNHANFELVGKVNDTAASINYNGISQNLLSSVIYLIINFLEIACEKLRFHPISALSLYVRNAHVYKEYLSLRIYIMTAYL